MKNLIPILLLSLLVVCTMSLRYVPTPKRVVVTATDGFNNVFTNDAAALYDLNPLDTLYFTHSFSSVKLTNLHGITNNPIYLFFEDSITIGGNFTYTLNLDHISWLNVIHPHTKADTTGAANGISISYYSNINIYGPKIKYGAIGIQAKTNVNSNPDSYYPTAINEYLSIYDARVDSVDGEGLYDGHTNSPGYVDLAHIAPPGIGGTYMRDSFFHCGWDGVQWAHRQNIYVNGIYVYDYGFSHTPSQWYGCIFGGASTYVGIYNVVVRKGPGPGLCFFNMGRTILNGAILDSTGMLTGGEGGAIYASNKYDYGQHLPKQMLDLSNITVTGPGRSDIPVFYNLDAAPTPGTWRSDSGYATNFVYDKSKWPTDPVYGKTRPINGTDGVATQLYQYNPKPFGKRQKIKL